MKKIINSTITIILILILMTPLLQTSIGYAQTVTDTTPQPIQVNINSDINMTVQGIQVNNHTYIQEQDLSKVLKASNGQIISRKINETSEKYINLIEIPHIIDNPDKCKIIITEEDDQTKLNIKTENTKQSKDQFAEEYKNILNKERQALGNQTVEISPKLMEIAQNRANYIAKTDCYAHKDQNNTPFSKIITNQGYSWRYCCENLAITRKTLDPQDAFTQWKNSPSHYQGMVKGRYTQMGIAQSGKYLVLILATPKNL